MLCELECVCLWGATKTSTHAVDCLSGAHRRMSATKLIKYTFVNSVKRVCILCTRLRIYYAVEFNPYCVSFRSGNTPVYVGCVQHLALSLREHTCERTLHPHADSERAASVLLSISKCDLTNSPPSLPPTTRMCARHHFGGGNSAIGAR